MSARTHFCNNNMYEIYTGIMNVYKTTRRVSKSSLLANFKIHGTRPLWRPKNWTKSSISRRLCEKKNSHIITLTLVGLFALVYSSRKTSHTHSETRVRTDLVIIIMSFQKHLFSRQRNIFNDVHTIMCIFSISARKHTCTEMCV